MPVGIRETDAFFSLLETISGRPTPEKYAKQRGRLVDAYVDGHKYIFGKRAMVYGEEDLMVGMCSFLAEIGVQPVLCASGGTSGKLQGRDCGRYRRYPARTAAGLRGHGFLRDQRDGRDSCEPDLVVGHSKGYPLAKKLNIPLIRVGFPIHDRVGGQRILHLGYAGAQHLFDTGRQCDDREKTGRFPGRLFLHVMTTVTFPQ